MLRAVRYEWKPASPATDQMEKKATKATTGLVGPDFIASEKFVAFVPVNDESIILTIDCSAYSVMSKQSVWGQNKLTLMPSELFDFIALRH